MLVTDRTRDILRFRRKNRELVAAGFVEVSENGDPLWRFQRGNWLDKRIDEVRIGPDGKRLWIKVSSP